MKESIVKLIVELIDMANNGMISFVVAVVATRHMTKDKIDKHTIKKKANVKKTSAHDNHDSEEHFFQKSSEITKCMDIHDNVNCTFHFHEYTDSEKDQ